jgi:hypothetical protein
MDFVSGTRKSYLTVDSPHMPLLNIVIDCKLVSIVFGEYHRICGSMERTGIRPKAKWSYLTCAVRLGTSVEKEMSILFRDLEREQEKDDLYKIKLKGARSSKDRKKQRFVELAGYINKYHKPNVIGEIVLSYKKWYQYLCLVGGKFNKDGTIEKGTPGSDNTIMRRKTGAEKILSEKHQEEIKIIIE